MSFTLAIIVTILALIYIISPIDILPDVIPIVGWTDDLLVLIIAGAFWAYALFSLLMPLIIIVVVVVILVGLIKLLTMWKKPTSSKAIFETAKSFCKGIKDKSQHDKCVEEWKEKVY